MGSERVHEADDLPSRSTSPISENTEKKPDPNSLAELERQLTGVAAEDFKPSKRLYVAFATLAVITLMVALDGTSLSVALPASLFLS